MSLLTLVRSACRRIGVPSPNVVATASDPTITQIYELAQEEGRELSRFGDWRALRKEKTFTTVAAETQTDPIPTDLDAFIDDTFWNRSRRLRLYGPASPREWQMWKAGSTFPVTGTFYLRGTSLLIQPTPAAGDTVAYEYRSSYWCQSAGSVAQETWAADTDTGIISERLMALGIIWRYKKGRGLAWQDDYDHYIYQVNQDLAKDQPRRVIDMKEGGPPQRIPGVIVPDMSWDVT